MFLLGNVDFDQGLGPHNYKGGAQCTEHHFHEWSWEGQENPQYVGKGPKLMSWQGASLWVLGRYLLDGTYHWYDRHYVWLQELLHGSQAQVTSDDPLVSAHAVIPRAVVTGHSSEKPSGYGCGLYQVRLFCDGPLCSRDMEVPYGEPGARSNVNWNQYLKLLTVMP